MDDKGSKIHATIKKTLMYKFEKLLVEGQVYGLTGFVLVDSNGDYKTTRHQYKICFMYNTEVRPMHRFSFETNAWSGGDNVVEQEIQHHTSISIIPIMLLIYTYNLLSTSTSVMNLFQYENKKFNDQGFLASQLLFILIYSILAFQTK